jgi:predicted transcriptional regulator of viral defense system
MRASGGPQDGVGRKNDGYRRSSVQRCPDDALAALAVEQHAVFHLDQLCDLGPSARAVQHRAAAGRLYRIYQGVYALVPLELVSRDGRFLAAVLACGPGAVLSHRSAAVLHELRRSDRTRIDVTIPQRSPRKHAGIDVHRPTTLAPCDITVSRNIPCTTVARTLLDLAQVIDRRGVERACDQAEILEVLDGRALLDQLRRNERRPAARRLRAVLDEHYIGSTPTWSELEEAFVRMCRTAHLPQPEVNVWIDPCDDEPSSIRADFVWREARLVVETDGRQTHLTRQAFEHDRRQDQRLVLAGWTVVRTTWRQVLRRPQEIAGVVVPLLRR